MIKEARKPSSDPLQEKLRVNKSQWNKEVSVFIDNLINFKKLMNGWPSKFHMERSSIKDEIPSDPKTILGVLAGDFQDLAQRGSALVAQQSDYSKNRKKKQPKAPAGAPPNLAQQLTASSEHHLEALGSTPVSRFYSKLKGPWFGSGQEARVRKYRISMLNSCADLYRQLEHFEAAIMGSSPESIFASSKILEKIENQVNFILNTITAYKSVVVDLPKDKPTDYINNDSKSEELDTVINDFKKHHLNFTDLNATLVNQLNENINKFESADLDEQAVLSPVILQDYKSIIDDFNRKHGTFAKTLGEALFAKQASSLESMAQAFLTKWLGKLKHHLSPFDKTSALRLDIFKVAEDSRKILNEMMNSLEKDFDIEDLVNKSNDLYNSLSSIRSLMKPLEDIIKNNMFDKTFINLLRNNDLTEYDFNLDKKQRERLQKSLETRKFRELSQMYHKR
jgi:hypothetical protein